MEESTSFQEKYERLRLLYETSNVIHSTLDPHEALKLIMREAVRLTRATSGSVVLVNPNSGFLEIQATHGLPSHAPALKLRMGEGITGWVAKSGESLRVGDVSEDKRYVALGRRIQSEMAIPLEVMGEVRGVINVDSVQKNAFSADDQDLLEALAMHASKVIQNTWHFEQLRLKARLLESLISVGRTINSTFNLQDALAVVARESCALLDCAKMSSVLILDESGQWLELKASHGASSPYIGKPRLRVDESLVGVVVRRKKPLQVDNVQESRGYVYSDLARQEGLVSLVSIPLVYNEESIGVLNVYTSAPHRYSDEEVRILLALAELSAIAIEKARLYERIMGMEEQLRNSEKLSALGLLAAEVAHEIRNPLTVMKMLFHSLGLDFSSMDPRAKDVRIISDKMDHLNKIVEQILDFARRPEMELSRIQLNEMIRDLGLLVRHKLNQSQIEWKPKLARDCPEIIGDSTQLKQAFLNLILNAVEAMPEGGTLTISTKGIGFEKPDSAGTKRVAVTFRDTGPGMTEEQQSRLFSSLLRSEKPRGLGLGMAIVSRVVETHQGKVRVQSKLGQGTQIRIELPLQGHG